MERFFGQIGLRDDIVRLAFDLTEEDLGLSGMGVIVSIHTLEGLELFLRQILLLVLVKLDTTCQQLSLII